jgi:hypothetical protein
MEVLMKLMVKYTIKKRDIIIWTFLVVDFKKAVRPVRSNCARICKFLCNLNYYDGLKITDNTRVQYFKIRLRGFVALFKY